MSLTRSIKTNTKTLERYLLKESPTILVCFAISGVFSTTILAVRPTPQVLYLIDRQRHLLGRDLTKPEIAKLVWKYYIPAVVSGAITIACIVGAHKIHLRRNAALLGLYTITEGALKEYQDKVIELIGKSKESKIHDEIAQDHLDKDPVDKKQIIITGKGETLFYDSLSGRYFKSDMESIRRFVNDFNEELLTDTYKPLNEFYDILGLESTEMGRTTGWDVNNGLLHVSFSAKIATNSQPCIVIDFKNGPKNL